MWLRFWQFLAIVSTAIYLVPTGAHLAEMHHKLAMDPSDYMIVQGMYSGWALFGIVVAVALVSSIVHTALVRDDVLARWLSLLAFACLTMTQVLFWVFTYPVNAATDNWVRMPRPFEEARGCSGRRRMRLVAC